MGQSKGRIPQAYKYVSGISNISLIGFSVIAASSALLVLALTSAGLRDLSGAVINIGIVGIVMSAPFHRFSFVRQLTPPVKRIILWPVAIAINIVAVVLANMVATRFPWQDVDLALTKTAELFLAQNIAVQEELFFRLFLTGLFIFLGIAIFGNRIVGVAAGGVFGSVVFMFYHSIRYGTQPGALVVVLVMGVAIVIAWILTGTIFLPIVVHVGVNTFAVAYSAATLPDVTGYIQFFLLVLGILK